MTTRDVYWIRHAQSTANAGERTANAQGIGLTELGRHQSQQLAARWTVRPGLIVDSPYIRTTLTARPLREKFEAVPAEQWPIHEFTFLTRGDAANTTIAERRALAAPYWEKADPFLELGDGGESFHHFYLRIAAALRRAAQYRGTGPLVLFTHNRVLLMLSLLIAFPRPTGNDMLRHLMQRLRAVAVEQHIEVPNTGVLRMAVHDDGSLTIGWGDWGDIQS